MTAERARTVVVAVPDFEPAVGGTVRQAGYIARGLARGGNEVVVVTRRRSRAWPTRETRQGITIERIGPAAAGPVAEAAALGALAWWLRRRRARIGVLQTLMWPDAEAAAAAAAVLERTVVGWAIRGEVERALGSSTGVRLPVVGLRRRLLARCAHLTLTPAMDAELAAELPGTYSFVIPIPVDTSRFRPPLPEERAAARAELGLVDDAFVVLYVGHLEPRKAVDRLVEAIALVARDRPKTVLLLVGGGRGDETERNLRRLVRQRGLEETARFCGVQPDPRRFLWAADALVLPSHREGMSNVLAEAMAAGIACVAPPSAGGDEILDDATGIVPPSNDPAHLADAIGELIDDPGRRAAMGRAASERAQAFAVDSVVARYAELYDGMSRRGRA